MHDDVTTLELVERLAFLDMHAAPRASVASSLGLAVAEIGDGVCTACAAAAHNPFLNRFRGLSGASGPREPLLHAAREFFRSRSIRAFGVDVAPGPAQTDVRASLISEGFLHASTAGKLVREGNASAGELGDPFDIVEVSEGRGTRDFAAAWTRGLPAESRLERWIASLPGRSGWHCKVAYKGSDPVACAASRIDASYRCWLGFSATLPEHRGQGAQAALLAALLRQAQDLRCEVAVTETGVGGGADLTSLRNLLRAGFRLAYERELYVSPVI